MALRRQAGPLRLSVVSFFRVLDLVPAQLVFTFFVVGLLQSLQSQKPLKWDLIQVPRTVRSQSKLSQHDHIHTACMALIPTCRPDPWGGCYHQWCAQNGADQQHSEVSSMVAPQADALVNGGGQSRKPLS